MYLRLRTACILLSMVFSYSALAAEAPDKDTISYLKAGRPVDIIVEYDSKEIDAVASVMSRKSLSRQTDLMNFKKDRYQALKLSADNEIARPDINTGRDYSHLPMAMKRVATLAALNTLMANSKVRAIYLNKPLRRVLVQSLPLINQPTVAAAGIKGNASTVAVIDDGINYGHPAFGACTSPGAPASCRVVASISFGSGSADSSHGSNVSAIVLGVAPSSKIAMLNAFSGDFAYTSDVIAGINWAIANQSTHNIVAINMSLGDGTSNQTACTASPFTSPVANARNAGISVVAASGNEAYTNGISGPACTPGVISVGAVYDANVGGLIWGDKLCTDATTRSDQIACFSNSANFLSLLAPGAVVEAAGVAQGGTSQAAPHVAGALAILRALYPAESLAQTQMRLTSSGVPITDARNGIVTPRLNLLAASRPLNDAYSNRFSLSGSSGATAGYTLLATKESGEPNHAGNAGARSVWWKWIAPASGQLSLDSHGSDFDTLLAIYTGLTVSTISPAAANDNDGSSGDASGLLMQVRAGQEYQIAVDGKNGEQGTLRLNWSLNSSAVANLSVSLTGPSTIATGTTANYSLMLHNAGPQSATNVMAKLNLPEGANYVSGSPECALTGRVVNCQAATLASTFTRSFSIQLLWNSAGGTLAATIDSDLPDSAITDNSASINVALNAVGANDSADIPTLPEWAMLLMAACLLGMAMRIRPGAR